MAAFEKLSIRRMRCQEKPPPKNPLKLHNTTDSDLEQTESENNTSLNIIMEYELI